jgi:type II secretory pathway pseudopilin PulG
VAIYHASTKPIARSAGRSAVAAAAYRAGVELLDSRTGLVHDYTRKRGVEHTEILTPDGLGAERNALWDAAELAEKRKDARTAREWVVALPVELDSEQRRQLAHDFAQALVERYGVAVDFAIHAPDREGDNRNYHAHILTTTRQVHRGPDGDLVFGDKAHIELSDKVRRERGLGAAADEVKAVREIWEHTANTALERAGLDARIDARSLEAQGIDREATQHLGPVASEMERRGKQSDRGDGNREVAANNARRARLSAEIVELQAERRRQEREAEAQARREAEEKAQAQAKAQQAQARRESLADIVTANQQRPGIRHPDKPHWQMERERILADAYNQDLAMKLGRWYRIERGPDHITLRNAQATITDHGDRVTAAQGNDREIAALVALAQAKGWEQVHLTGPQEFQARAAQAFVAAGIGLDDPALEQTARQALRREREAQAQREAMAQAQAQAQAQQRDAIMAQTPPPAPTMAQEPAPEPMRLAHNSGNVHGTIIGVTDGGKILLDAAGKHRTLEPREPMTPAQIAQARGLVGQRVVMPYKNGVVQGVQAVERAGQDKKVER